MSSPLIFVRDGRSLPFFPVTQAALDAIRHAITTSPPAAGHAKRLPQARSLYLAILELANELRGAEVPASRKRLGELAGMSRDLVSDLRSLLERAGVVRVEERDHEGQRLENVWIIVEPTPVAASHGGAAESGGSGPQPRGSRLPATGVVAPSHSNTEEGEEVEDSLRSSPTQSPSTSSSSETAGDEPAAPPQSESPGEKGDTEGPPPAKYVSPASPGAAAAPWMVLELARLMRRNDDRAKVPAPIAGMETLPRPSTQDAAREQIAAVLHTPALKPWLDAARLLIDTDGREPREVVKVLRWCQADEFWKTNVLSMAKFREKYPQLRGRALGQTSPRSSATAGTDARSQLDAIAGRREADEPGKASGDAA
jgi:hypothetical protein